MLIDDAGMNIGRATDCRRVAEMGRHATDRVAKHLLGGPSVAVLRLATGDDSSDTKRTILNLARLKAFYGDLSQIANSLGQEADRR